MSDLARYSQLILMIFLLFNGFRVMFWMFALLFKSNETSSGSGVPDNIEFLNNIFAGDRQAKTRNKLQRAVLWSFFFLFLLGGHWLVFRLSL